MNQDKNNVWLAVLAGLVIGWFLGAGRWELPGRLLVLVLAVGLVVVILRRSNGVGADKDESVTTVSPAVGGASVHDDVKKESDKQLDDGEALSPEEAREWLDDLLVEQQKREK